MPTLNPDPRPLEIRHWQDAGNLIYNAILAADVNGRIAPSPMRVFAIGDTDDNPHDSIARRLARQLLFAANPNRGELNLAGQADSMTAPERRAWLERAISLGNQQIAAIKADIAASKGLRV